MVLGGGLPPEPPSRPWFVTFHWQGRLGMPVAAASMFSRPEEIYRHRNEVILCRDSTSSLPLLAPDMGECILVWPVSLWELMGILGPTEHVEIDLPGVFKGITFWTCSPHVAL